MENMRIFDFALEKAKSGGIEKAMGRKNNKDWIFYSHSELVNRAYKLAGGLLSMGLKSGDKVAMVAYVNCPEWMAVDLATQLVGIINVPLYPTISAGEYVYILNDSEVKVAFAGEGDLIDKLKEAQKEVSSLKNIFALHDETHESYWEKIYKDDSKEKIDTIASAISPDDVATIIYTSGTTGKPKGVVLTHKNIVSVIDSTTMYLPISPGDKVLSFLPLCHIFERAAINCYINLGCSVYFTGTDNLGGPEGDLANVQPYFFTTVPRLLEKVYEKIYNKGLVLTGLKRKLFFWALSLTDEYEFGKTFSGLDALKRKIADRLIFSKWREALGGNVKGIVTGAAPCPAKISRVFSAAGIPVLEGYGLTETSPTLTVNRLNNGEVLIGSVGMVVRDVELMIDDSDGNYKEGEGEILAKGPNVMQGYYRKPEETAAVFKEIDGVTWFRTGDVGKFVSGPNGKQFLKITDRKKELLKTSGGKYVAPAPIENKIKEDFLVEQIMVIGDQKKFVSALIVPAEEALKNWCSKHEVNWTTLSDIIKHEKVISRYQKCLDKYNPLFSHVEQIKKFALLDCTWESIRKDGTESELTPTMKLKRRVIQEKFGKTIDELYAE
jgi:long-chain acyl-CoA synthetase